MPQPSKEFVTPVQKLQPHEIEQRRMRELLSKVRIKREANAFGRGNISEASPHFDRSKKYVWINTNQHRQIEYLGLNYEIVKTPNPKPGEEPLSSWQREDGTHVRGDLILMAVDKEFYEALKLEEQLRAFEAMEIPAQQFADFAAAHSAAAE